MMDQSPLSETPALWATPSLLPLPSLVSMTPLFWKFPLHSWTLLLMPLPWLLSLCPPGFCPLSNVDVPWASSLGLLLSAPAQPLSVISLMPGLQLPSVADNNQSISI